MMPTQESRFDSTPGMRDLAAVFYRRRWLIAAVTIAMIGLSALYTYTRTPVYTSSVGILVRPPLTSLTSIARPPDIDSQTETNLATSAAVASLASELMASPETNDALLKDVTANMVTGTQFLTITFSAADAAAAMQGAQAFGDAYLQYRRERAGRVVQQQAEVLTVELQEVRARIRSISAQLRNLPPGSFQRASLTNEYVAVQNQLISLLSITTDPGEVVDPATEPLHPSSPRHPFDLALGALLGLGLGVGLALVLERGSHTVRSATEFEQGLGAPVLASIPKRRRHKLDKALVVGQGRRTITADAYRRLRTSLLDMAAGSGIRTLLITSPAGGEGKTAIVANLGAALAEIGKQVTIVSADLRQPGLDRVFRVTGEPGLSEALAESGSPLRVVRATAVPGLQIVPSGAMPPHTEPVNLLQSERMQALLMAWANHADIVLIDAPPVLRAPDPLVLARIVDGVVFVAADRDSRWEDIALARDELDRAGGIVAGVLNGVIVSRRDQRAWKRGSSVRRTPTVDRRRRSSGSRATALRQEQL